jgi:hypothetical protein
MAEDAFIRRRNLNRLCHARGWGPRELVDRAGKSYSYWRDLLTNPDKSFGERVARDIERTLHLPRLWLDSVDDSPIPSALTAGETEASYGPAAHWPFSQALFVEVRSLSTDELTRLELVMRAHLGL